jgi:ribonuclease BN (tRNA processing enzyme)
MKRTAWYLVIAPLVACWSGCTHKVSKFYPEIIPARNNVAVPLKVGGSHKVGITYLGCGNLVLEQDGESIMTDPFFSNQKMLALLGKIRTKPELHRRWKSELESQVSKSSVRSILVSHTHYDHVMDLPTLLHDHYFQNLEVVYGNRYLPRMLTNFRKEGPRLDSLTRTVVYNPTQANDTEWKWVQVTPGIRFLPIRSDHAPHTKKTLYMSKPLNEGYFEKNLIWPTDKVGAFKWTVGDSYSFLVDFIQSDTLRVFIQTSASHHPNGMPPKAELDKKKVDMAIMCYASAPNVDDYPNKWIEWMTPKKLVLIHWEDFFRDARNDDDYKLVRGTKPWKVRKRIDALGKKRDYFIMPRPGTRMDVTF